MSFESLKKKLKSSINLEHKVQLKYSKCFLRGSLILSPNSVKRISSDHLDEIDKLIDGTTNTIFGEFDLMETIVKRYTGLGIYDDHNLVGAIVLYTYPNIPSISKSNWEEPIQKLYGIQEVNCTNTLWIHLVVWDYRYYFLFLKPMLQVMFAEVSFLVYCILVIPPVKVRLDFLENLGTLIRPKNVDEKSQCQCIYVIHRNSFVKQYKIRRAVVEDNDDINPLIAAYYPEMINLYGDYFVSELLTTFSGYNRHLVVAEYEGNAVAMLCLNDNVNYKMLNEEFELTPYNGLKKPSRNDKTFLNTPSILAPNEYEEDAPEWLEIGSMKSEEVLSLQETDSDDYSLIFTTNSLFLFQDDDDDDDDNNENDSEDLGQNDDKNQLDSDIILRQLLLGLNVEECQYDVVSECLSSTRTITLKMAEFYGEPNAFTLELAVFHPDHENVASDLFEAAYQCFTDKDYCLISMPSVVNTNRLEDFFTRIPPKPNGEFPQELFIMHKNAIFGKMLVQPCAEHHFKHLSKLLQTVGFCTNILKKIYANIMHDENNCFVLTCESDVVGVALLQEEQNIDYLKAHYDVQSLFVIDVHQSGDHGLLECCIVNPIFQRHYKFFIRELHRLSQYSIIYYKHKRADSMDDIRDRPILNILPELLCIIPRNLPKYNLEILEKDDCVPPKYVIEEEEPYTLFVTTMPISGIPRYIINTKIVIVGCNRTALAFLQALLLQQQFYSINIYTNITIIALSNVLFTEKQSKLREAFLIKKHILDNRVIEMMGIKTHVNIVKGKLSKINRKDKFVVVNENNNYISYDLLFLMAGEVYRKPTRNLNGESISEQPDNVFVINSSGEASNAVEKLAVLRRCSKEPTIIVYGHSLQAYVCIHGLLSYGVSGKHIIFVEHFPYSMATEKRQRHNVSIFNNPVVDQTVNAYIIQQGIKVYSSFYFVDWVYNESTNMITSIFFESRHKMLEIHCMAMFYFCNKEISPRMYQVITRAGLVYDGRLVIDATCRTNDPNIYAAGTLTKYSRKYYCNNRSHKFFNRMEVGYNLGVHIRKLLIPPTTFAEKKIPCGWNFKMETSDKLLPRYVTPIMTYCRLPGGLYYLSIVRPGIQVPLETAVQAENYGRVFITGNCNNIENQGYFRLHLNAENYVETITCLTKFPMDIDCLYQLWGKHEKLLNNIRLRFEMFLIKDFFEYFKEPWAYAIYHDKFQEFIEDLNLLMTSTIGGEGTSLINQVISEFKNTHWAYLTEDVEIKLENQFKDSPYARIIQTKLLNFIKANMAHLTMYAHPVIVQRFLKELQDSPLYASS